MINDSNEEYFYKMKISKFAREGKITLMLKIFNCTKKFHL